MSMNIFTGSRVTSNLALSIFLLYLSVLAETVLIPQIFDDFLTRKGILNVLFGNICFKNNIVTLLIDLIKIF